EPRRARQKTVARDDEIGVDEVARAIHLQFAAGRCRWMRYDGLQAGHKSRDLGGPVGEQRCRSDEEARLATSLLLQHQEQRQDLDRLSEPHVISKTGPEPQLGKDI